MSASQNCCCQCLCPCSELQLPSPSPLQETLQYYQVGLAQSLKGFYPWVLVHTRLCVCPPRTEFLFHPVLWKPCIQTLLAFKARFSGDSSSRYRIPRLGSLMWGSELSLPWENFCDIIILQFVSHPPSRYGI